jgi:serine/threonine-protein kinase HipA
MVQLAVLVSDQYCATIDDAGGKPHLQYDMASEGVTHGRAVSISMPPRGERYGGAVVSNWLWNLLPDNDATLQSIARDTSHSHSVCSWKNPVRLLEKVGEDCAGAVQIVHMDMVGATRDSGIQHLSGTEVENIIRGLRSGQNLTGRDQNRTRGQFSLAGAQPKTALRRLPDGTWGVPFGREATTHILKPPIIGYDGQVENEHFCLCLAAEIGIPAAKSEVMMFGDEKAIVVERFDRRLDKASGMVSRIHTEDMCQAIGKSPKTKYQEFGGPGIIDIVSRVLSISGDRDNDVGAFLTSCALNWVIGGTDAHAKNYSVYIGESGGSVFLAPLYDLNSFLPYPEYSPTRSKMSMAVGGRYTFEGVGLRQWQKTLESCGIASFKVGEWLAAISEALAKKAPDVAQECLAAGLDRDSISSVALAIAKRAEELKESLTKD